MSILVFGFEPFLEYDENPTEIMVKSLEGRSFGGDLVTAAVLPVDYRRIDEVITRAVAKAKPTLVIGFGLAAGREKITPEKIAVNHRHAEKADNAGRKVHGSPIDPKGPDGLFSNLPVEGLVASLNRRGIPASLSLSAGSFLCNAAMYVTVREAKEKGFRGGFVHVPCHSEWIARKKKATPSLPLDTLLTAAQHSVEYCASHKV